MGATEAGAREVVALLFLQIALTNRRLRQKRPGKYQGTSRTGTKPWPSAAARGQAKQLSCASQDSWTPPKTMALLEDGAESLELKRLNLVGKAFCYLFVFLVRFANTL